MQPRLLTLTEVLAASRDNPDVMLARQSLAAARADVLPLTTRLHRSSPVS